ncbi:MAG: ABC transporter ATP-binding protein [Salinigranum sp.]
MSSTSPLLEVQNLKKYYPVGSGGVVSRRLNLTEYVKAVDGVSFGIDEGETLALVGESGCGKTTIGRCILQLEELTDGEIHLRGKNVASDSRGQLRDSLWKEVQMVFQDPKSSLNRRKKVGQIIGSPLEFYGIATGADKRARVTELLEMVGLPADLYNRFPSELSGGQQQRIGIARALAVDPKLIVLDEPVTALDVSIQAQIINLLEDLQEEFGLSYLLISHDLSVVEHIADRVAVMYLGELAELGPADQVFDDPKHPYTQVLLDAVPNLDPTKRRDRLRVEGEPPTPIDPPSGCRFHPRCPKIVQPAEMDLPEKQWRRFIRFRRLVNTDFASLASSDAADVEDRIRDPQAFVESWFEGGVPDDVADLVVRSCELVNDGRREEAEALLSERIQSPCERDVPRTASVTGEHDVRCHLYE